MTEQSVKSRLASSYLNGTNSSYIESLYEEYLENVSLVSKDWQDFFASLPKEQIDILHSKVISQIKSARPQVMTKDNSLDNLRKNAFLSAQTNPLLVKNVDASLVGPNKDAYIGSIGIEADHLRSLEQKHWLYNKIEQKIQTKFSREEKVAFYERLVAANGFEQFLARKFVAQKRFSLEGGDSLIVLLDSILDIGAKCGVEEFAMAMAHRGRLNVMANVFGVSMQEIQDRFVGKQDKVFETSGDVKYHLGASVDRYIDNKAVHLSLAFNPSHLEFVNPVLQGIVRSKIDAYYPNRADKICAITMHGDAAVCGQGIVPETLNLSRTSAHTIGGGIHIVINNQVGHSVSDIKDMTSCYEITDVFKAYAIPVIHVNGDDVEAVAAVGQIAIEYRQKFNEEIAIDLICYRRLGHNEADEPSVTQPVMYQNINDMPRLYKKYLQSLINQGILDDVSADAIDAKVLKIFDDGKSTVDTFIGDKTKQRHKNWSQYFNCDWQSKYKSAVDKKHLISLAKKLHTIPSDFVMQQQIQRLFSQREDMIADKKPLNWGMAELLAYATLVDEGHVCRLVGQDVRRGTFTHRQAVIHDFNNGFQYNLFSKINNAKASFSVYDSTLSEAAVLGAEYGYSLANPDALVLWEAQFGDFANSAQVIIDQFISSGWQKWQQLSNLVLLLPHGYEGQGPEHSSARLERYLQLAAQHSIQVCVPTTPAQIFHLLRRQVLRKFRQPLIIMSPKSLLRHPQAVSSWDDLASQKFACVIGDDLEDYNKINKIVFCSGKVYYDLYKMRETESIHNIAIIRVEQLYPFPYDDIKALLAKYRKVKDIYWCQEEPRNQGAWFARRHCFEQVISDKQKLHYVGRDVYASTAAGSPTLHAKRQDLVIKQALGLLPLSLVSYD